MTDSTTNTGRVPGTPEYLASLSPSEARELLHDLQVHQVELEAQNEELRRAQHELEATRARYFDLYDLAPVGYVTINGQGTTLEANLTAARLLGMARGMLVTTPLTRFMLPEGQDLYYQHRKQLLETGLPQVFELMMRRQDNSEFWAHLEAILATDSSGTSVCRLALTDLTERKRMEDALRLADARYLSIIEDQTELICRYRPDGRLSFVNEAYVRYYGLPRQRLLNHNYIPNIPEPDISTVIARVRGITTAAPTAEFEHRVIMPDGTVRWQQWRHHGIFADMGELQEYQAVGRDITARKRAEAEHELLSMAIEQADEVIVITDTAARIQYVNPAFTRITGYTREEALGQNPRLLKSGKQDPAFYRDLWQSLAGGRTWTGRLINQRKDGTLYTEEASISPVCDATDQVVGYVAVKHDITEQLRLEDQLRQAQKMEAVGRLAGGVAHDFNNMLQTIRGNADLALEDIPQGNPLRDFLVEIQRAAVHSADLTQQLLAFARKQVITPRVLDLNETVAAMIKMLRRLIGEDIKLQWEPGTDTWPVLMDQGQLNQILANLTVNARDAITGGTGTITISTGNAAFAETGCQAHPEIEPDNYILLTVSDTGCGMDNATQSKIFEPFFTTKEQGKGTGLGLAMVYGVVKQNRGYIYVTSDMGKGTTFRIYLPRHVVTEDDTRPAPPTPPPRATGAETVLVVEDDPGLLHSCRLLMERRGYTVLTADSAPEAIRLCQAHTGDIHLLLTDVIMPGMSGRKLCEQLTGSRPAIKCLYMSGYTADILAPHGVLDRGVHFIQKPFSQDAIAAMIRKVLDDG